MGCYNKPPETGWLIDHRNGALTVLDAGKSKVKVLAESTLGSDSWLREGHFLDIFSHNRRGRDVSGVSCQDSNPLHAQPILMI